MSNENIAAHVAKLLDTDEELVSTFPIWTGGKHEGMKGIVFAYVPGEATPQEKMVTFLKAIGTSFDVT